jgi:anthranilate synthase/aminodeoxychorismate synthase-like glutamine amidotransferase
MGARRTQRRAGKIRVRTSAGENAEVILLLDNYDSFTYNLAQYLGELGCDVEVHRNDKISVDEIARRKPERIVISPGPCTPQEAGISMELVAGLAGKFPILGVCLGHQAIGAAFGGKIKRAPQLFHGKTSEIHHDDKGVFRGLADPFTATRYHSLIVERKSLPRELVVTAETDDGIIMGLRHRRHKIEGVQFHPESVLTESGKKLLKNFLEL